MKRPPLLPLLPLVLLGVWLLLNDSATPGTVALGAVLALSVSAASTRLRPLPAWPHRLYLAAGLIWNVFVDIVRSNLAVGRIVLSAAKRPPRAGFMQIALDLTDPHGLAMLSLIITGTPGTVWAGHDARNNLLTLHVLDLVDEAAWVRTIKHRYERPLMGIFQ